MKVKLIGDVQPVPPATSPGMPFAPVEFEGLTVTPYVDSNTNRLAYSFRAKSMRAPKTGGRSTTSADGKAAA